MENGAKYPVIVLENGAMFENFVAEEWLAHGFKTFYFNNKKHGEVDFLIEYQGELLPIEVKSGKNYQTHSALTYFNFITTKYFNKTFVLSDYNISVKNNIIYLPIYMTMFINKNEYIKKVNKIDLSILSNAK